MHDSVPGAFGRAPDLDFCDPGQLAQDRFGGDIQVVQSASDLGRAGRLLLLASPQPDGERKQAQRHGCQ